ncbi:hypothetical protein ACGFQG_26695 [Nocardia fluminea]
MLGHHGGDLMPGEAEEAPADGFAAQLLQPEVLLISKIVFLR